MAKNKEITILPKILAVLGPTSSGKSDLAVELALRLGGEVVSVDSRQVYIGLDIASGKITKEEMRGIPHHLLDVADPKIQYTVSHFKRDAEAAIDDIISRKKIPILCGGAGQYAQAILDNFITPDIPPNEELRNDLSKKTVEELFEELKKLDPLRAKNIDHQNPRRLIRAIEIAKAVGSVPSIPEVSRKYDAFVIGISVEMKTLEERIAMRTEKRLREGMIDEAKKLHANGVAYDRMHELGLEYGLLADYLEGKLSAEELKKQIILKDRQYAKRQMTWLKKDKNIHWYTLEQITDIFRDIENFLK